MASVAPVARRVLPWIAPRGRYLTQRQRYGCQKHQPPPPRPGSTMQPVAETEIAASSNNVMSRRIAHSLEGGVARHSASRPLRFSERIRPATRDFVQFKSRQVLPAAFTID